ncbi:hypothetical protein [Enterovirga aerilata]|uniref:Uncharacterized protein n=1 Tax=Enterovirga aerilata TaxID=2730920 RepID=A0A849I4S8_9HYPH|nr:hypothetical protein [Enterovirga sp. DB1703]NNM72331.1 hypothetical protein [Enterovirga sp. DB1703]
MSGWKSLAIACGCLLIAGGVQAQTSLFEPPASGSGAAPLTPPAEEAAPAARPRAKVKPKGPTPARALSITNDSGSALTALEVSAEGKTARLAKELGSGQTVTLRLPALKSCTVTISATFQRAGEADLHEQDICKDRKVRFVN